MQKKISQKLCVVLTMLALMLAIVPSTAFASNDDGKTSGVNLDWIEQDSGQLNDVTDKAKGLFSSVYGLIMVVFNAVAVIALIIILLGCLTNITNQMTRAQLKPALLTWVIVVVVANSALSILYIVTSVKV